MVKAGLEQVRRCFGDYELRQIDIVTDGLAPHYAGLANTDVVTAVREASKLFVSAEGQLELGNSGAEVVDNASEALKIFRTSGHEKGICDSLRLLVHACRARANALVWAGDLGEKVEKALSKARLAVGEELELSQELARPRNEAAMLLSQAELIFLDGEDTLNKRGRIEESVEARQRRFFQSIEKAEQKVLTAVAKFEDMEDVQMQVVALLALSRLRCVAAASANASFQKAREAAQQALEAASHEKDSRGEALARLQIVATQVGDGQLKEALDGLTKNQAEVPGSKKLRGSLLHIISQRKLPDDPRAALPLAREAHGIFRELKYGKGWEAAALGSVVEALIETKASREAQKAAEQAVAELKARDPKEGARAMYHLVHAMVVNEVDEEATTKVANEAAEICCQELTDQHSKVLLYLTITKMYLKAKWYRRASEAAGRAEIALQELGNSDDSESLNKFFSSLQFLITEGDAAARKAALDKQRQKQLQDGKIFKESVEPLADYDDAEVGTYEADDAAAHARGFLESYEEHMKNNRFEEALKAASIAVDLFYDNDEKRGEAQALLAVSGVHVAMENFKLALWAAKSSLEIFREIDDREGQAEALHALASVHNNMQNPKEALLVAHEALGIFQNDLQVSHGVLKVYFVIVDSYVLELEGVSQADRQTKDRHRTNTEKALTAAKKASRLAMDFDALTEGCAQHYLATAYMMADNHKNAVQAAEEARLLFKKADEASGQIQAMTQMGEALMALRKRGKAKTVLNEALKMAKGAFDQEANQISTLLAQLTAEETLSAARVAAPQAMLDGSGEEASTGEPQGVLSTGYQAPDPAEISKRIGMIATDMTGEDDMDADTPFMDAGIDSLASVELRTNLQKMFGVSLPSTVMFNYPTRASIADYITTEMTEGQVSLK